MLRQTLFAGLAFVHSQGSVAQPQPEWEVISRPEGSTEVRATVVFHQPRMEEAQSLLMDISNPASTNFGQFLDREALEDLFGPSNHSQRKVLDWLESAGVPTTTVRLRKAAASMEFPATISQMESLLETEYHIRENSLTGKRQLEGSAHNIPTELEDHVHFVTSTLTSKNSKKRPASGKRAREFFSPSPYVTRSSVDLRNCSLSWTPACIRELYEIPLGTTAAPNNSLGIFGFGDAYNQADLDNFWSQYAEFIPNGTAPKVNSINGATAPGRELDGEELLDLQMAYPIAWPQEVEIFQTPDNNAGGLGNDFLDAVDPDYCTFDGGDDPLYDPTYPQFQGYQGPAMCGTYNVTNVVSISFALDESSLTQHYVQRQCNEWMKLALRGVTVLVASGDRGVMGQLGCLLNPENDTAAAFNPLFPSSCPYVTTVGATQVNFTETDYQEVAVYDPKHNYYSGGGFSNFNAQPAYQQQAVADYFQAYDPRYPNGTFNQSGRAFPDVAMLGANVTLSDGLEITVSGGTSAATPLFAAIISRINDERILAGKKPIGFLNQILYQHPEVFTDITDGYNPGCGTQGFEAGKGWDPVSGLGSPNFPKLRDLLVGLP
ncbi:putative Peptidase S8/S53 domain-containing protein [Seiridium unicorne]|uniref:Peptidase S8/S53 domain-containing protein n=1 Tax=Seiridium unicorne TaxID=138068 RepID=A0ABR2V1W8_9PEZI